MKLLSASNKRIKLLASLSRKQARYKEGLVFLEGARLVRDSARYGARILSAFYREGYTGGTVTADEEFLLPDAIFDRLTDTVTPQGICAIAEMPQDYYPEIGKAKSDMLVFCDNVRDPGNLGTVIRTAHALGAGAVLVSAGCTDPYGLKCVRAAMGSVFGVPIARADADRLRELKKSGWALSAGVLTGESVPLYEADLSGRVIIAVGNEALGISEDTAQLCDAFLRIPMFADAESLNAAVAAGIMMYEKTRQNS